MLKRKLYVIEFTFGRICAKFFDLSQLFFREALAWIFRI